MRYFLELTYKGTNFHGWQVQDNAKTIQRELNKVFSLILSEEINITGAGRTDTGVHADYFVAHFDCKNESLQDDDKFIAKVNQFLCPDIAVYSITKVPEDSHSRFQAISRTYYYYVHHRKNPFKQDISWFLHRIPDYDKMNECAELLLKYSDFKSFVKLHSDVQTTNCKVEYAKWDKNDDIGVFRIQADRFLRNMVRSIVGTLLDIGYGKIEKKQFELIVMERNRTSAGQSVPAKGLFLSDILYPSGIFVRRN